MNWLVNSWYQPSPIRWVLAPLSGLYRGIMALRRYLYQCGIFKSTSLPVPVIIVGNINVGGTGKTPVVIWLAKQLQRAGYQPGIISRGYGGQATDQPMIVNSESTAYEVGDEPVIIHRQSGCPMVVGSNRAAAGQLLLSIHQECNVVISDDGLQHYALNRDIELVVIDGQRGFGNKYCLPAGPLREPLSRLKEVDYLIHNGSKDTVRHNMLLQQSIAINLTDPNVTKPLEEFATQQVNAVAGIGNPQRFFDQLTRQGIDVTAHPFADHHPFVSDDLVFSNPYPILMTEKDAVKCHAFADNNMWYIPIEATISGKLDQNLLDTLAGLPPHG